MAHLIEVKIWSLINLAILGWWMECLHKFLFIPLLTLCNKLQQSKYTINHLRTHNDFRSRDSSISVVWEILMTNYCAIFSWMDRSDILFSNTYLCNSDWYHYIPWPVKYDYLSEYMLVLICCYSHNNNRLGMFRTVFLYASRFYYPNHIFDNSSRITIHWRFIQLYKHKNNKETKKNASYIYVKSMSLHDT